MFIRSPVPLLGEKKVLAFVFGVRSFVQPFGVREDALCATEFSLLYFLPKSKLYCIGRRVLTDNSSPFETGAARCSTWRCALTGCVTWTSAFWSRCQAYTQGFSASLGWGFFCTTRESHALLTYRAFYLSSHGVGACIEKKTRVGTQGSVGAVAR